MKNKNDSFVFVLCNLKATNYKVYKFIIVMLSVNYSFILYIWLCRFPIEDFYWIKYYLQWFCETCLKNFVPFLVNIKYLKVSEYQTEMKLNMSN